MKFFISIIFFAISLFANNCLVCHEGIEDIRDINSNMSKEISKLATKAGFSDNSCIVCHGGNPTAITKELAHNGTIEYFKNNRGAKEFYPNPASPWVNENSCGICHSQHTKTQYSSLMFSEAGKIQGTLWSFGSELKYEHKYANFDINISHKKYGTKIYQNYMSSLKSKEPNVYPLSQQKLPPAPTADEVEKNPKLAVYTYLRQECLRCHTGVKGSQREHYGEFRGIGCSACHIPYSNSGLYEGGDKSISKSEKGHPLVHTIQSTREAKVKVNNKSYSGILVETCTTCHNRGKRIGVSYQGLMESSYQSPFLEDGSNQPKLHGKNYIHLKSDIHLKKGMLCQDCHTSLDMHGDGNIRSATLGAVEIECQDCHGTTKKYPWELPLGYSDEFDTKPKNGTPRGLTNTLADFLKQGIVYPKEDGYLLSARGNPLTNVVKKDDNSVIVHLASGKDINLKPLKKLKEDDKLSNKALTAMDNIEAHNDRLECYTCHASWAPQCYGCHVKIDYSNNNREIDWLKCASDVDKNGQTADMRGNLRDYLIDGKVTESRSYLRWEDPPLSQNGEGRFSPTIPGCQTTITVIGKDGNTLLENHIFKIKDVENSKEQLAIDMSPIQPHTIQKEARKCESCHTNSKSMGLGINLMEEPNQKVIMDLKDSNGVILSKNAKTYFNSIDNLEMDWSKFVDKNGTQLQTVGHHFKLSRALNKEELDKLNREGICISCHNSIPNGNLAINLMNHLKEIADIKIDNNIHKEIVNKSILMTAWVQILIVLVTLLFIIFIIYKMRRKLY